MTPKVMAYFFKNDYYLKADVYDKVTMHFYLLFFLTGSKCKEKVFSISLFPMNHNNIVLLSINRVYKQIRNTLFSRGKYLFPSLKDINRLSLLYCMAQNALNML